MISPQDIEEIRGWFKALFPQRLAELDLQAARLDRGRERAVAELAYGEAARFRYMSDIVQREREETVRKWQAVFPILETYCRVAQLLEAVDLLRAMVSDLQTESDAYRRGYEAGHAKGVQDGENGFVTELLKGQP